MEAVAQSGKIDGLTPSQILSVRRHLEEVLASPSFAGSRRAQDFLQLIIGHALEGDFDSLRERMIGAEMFGRPIDYDTGERLCRSREGNRGAEEAVAVLP